MIRPAVLWQRHCSCPTVVALVTHAGLQSGSDAVAIEQAHTLTMDKRLLRPRSRTHRDQQECELARTERLCKEAEQLRSAHNKAIAAAVAMSALHANQVAELVAQVDAALQDSIAAAMARVCR
eukprot:364111-Chlamydomonas_euryale.AAC.15